MTITLDTPHPYDPGHGQPVLTFPEVKIVQIDHEIVGHCMVLHMQYGETAGDGEWVGTPVVPRYEEVIENFQGVPDGEGGWLLEPDPKYDLYMVSTFPENTTDPSYDQDSKALYQYLIDDSRYEGTISP